jgi:hypothetical protein
VEKGAELAAAMVPGATSRIKQHPADTAVGGAVLQVEGGVMGRPGVTSCCSATGQPVDLRVHQSTGPFALDEGSAHAAACIGTSALPGIRCVAAGTRSVKYRRIGPPWGWG